METQYTRTPWFVDEDENGDRVIVDAPEAGIIIARNPSHENAAFIVRAVNSHERLLLFTKDLRDIVKQNLPKFGEMILEALNDAIAKAEGK